MRGLDFSSWSTALSTILGLLLMSLLMIGVRLLFMQTIQRRRERENRQINERLRTLIAAYKVLGGSFTGALAVDPTHLRDLRNAGLPAEGMPPPDSPAAERARRTRDAVEAALSDIILLGTEEQVRLAAHAASEMVAGRKVELATLVVSLRDFIRQALDLAPVAPELQIPPQGPQRTGGASGGTRGAGAARGGAAGPAGGGRGGGGGGAAGASMGGVGLGMGVAMQGGRSTDGAAADQPGTGLADEARP